MLYNICFDIAALVIYFTICILYVTRKNIPTRQNFFFLSLYINLFFAATISLVNGILLSHQNTNLQFALAINVIYKISLITIPLTYFYFVQSFCIKETDKLMKRSIAVCIFTFCQISFLLSSVKNGWLFYLKQTENHTLIMIEKPQYYLTFVFSLATFIISAIILGKTKEKIPRRSKLIIVFFVVHTTIVQIIQILMNNLFYPERQFVLLNFCFSVSILLIYFIIQRPDDFINNVSHCYNQSAFCIVANKQIKEKKVYVIGLIIEDYNFLVSTFSIETLNLILQEIARNLENETGLDVYHVKSGQFCLVGKLKKRITNEEFIKLIKKHASKINSIFQKDTWKEAGIELNIFMKMVIFLPRDMKNADNVIDTLDTIISDTKFSTGRKNEMIKASSVDNSSKKRIMDITNLVKNNLRSNRIEVYYQPIYSIAKKRICGAEALIRMRDEKGNFMNPEEFIPIAERNGYIASLGEYVFESVCRMIKIAQPDRYGIEKISINLSVVQCMSKEFSNRLLQIADNYKVPHNFIELEITETAPANYLSVLKHNMDDFVSDEIELALDDYGSGLANLNYLLELPFSIVKIDKEIVWRAFKDEKAKKALRATTAMIKELGMKVLAEGIETQEQKDLLTELGYDFLQGFYFSKAVPVEEFINFIVDEMSEHPENYADLREKTSLQDDIEELEGEESDTTDDATEASETSENSVSEENEQSSEEKSDESNTESPNEVPAEESNEDVTEENNNDEDNSEIQTDSSENSNEKVNTSSAETQSSEKQ